MLHIDFIVLQADRSADITTVMLTLMKSILDKEKMFIEMKQFF